MYKRLFIAIEIPEVLRCEIRKLDLSAKSFKPVKPDQLHITLRFIGDFPEDDIPELIKKLEEITFPEFKLTSTSPGFFPNKKRPTVFFLGFTAPPELLRLKSKIDDVLEAFDLSRETRKLVPHLTFGRFKKRPGKDVPYLFEEKSAKLATTSTVSEFILFSSELRNDGAIHSVEGLFNAKEKKIPPKGGTSN